MPESTNPSDLRAAPSAVRAAVRTDARAAVLAAVLAVSLAAPGAAAQSTPGPPGAPDLGCLDHMDLWFDDTPLPPETGKPVVDVTHFSVLKATAASVAGRALPELIHSSFRDGDGVQDPIPVDGNSFFVVIQGLDDDPASRGYLAPMASRREELVSGDGCATCPPGVGSFDTYDFDVTDVNGDGWNDLVVGRRLSTADVQLGARDTVFLNDGTPEDGESFPAALALPLHNPSTRAVLPPGETLAHVGQTFAVELGDVDGDGHPDLLTGGGDYGIRYYRNEFFDEPAGTFRYMRTYGDADLPGASGPFEHGWRDLRLRDLDGDGDLDLFAARRNKEGVALTATESVDGDPVTPCRVFLNLRRTWDCDDGFILHPPAFDRRDPFLMSSQSIRWPELRPITFRRLQSATCTDGPAEGSFPAVGAAVEVDLADLDGDGDLDLVMASAYGLNGAYLNDGRGGFGTLDEAPGCSPANDGLPAYTFPAVTPDWVGPSRCLMELAESLLSLGYDFGDCASCEYEFTVPGAALNGCTGVAIADLDGPPLLPPGAPGLPDVAFSNRNDLEELCDLVPDGAYLDEAATLARTDPCFDPAPLPAPPTRDFIFYNRSTPGNLDFCASVESIEGVDDGTGYGEFVDIDGDGRLDWIDANTSNRLQGSTNRVWWGTDPPGHWNGCPSGCIPEAPPPAPSGVAPGDPAARVSLGPEHAGRPYLLFATPSGARAVGPLLVAWGRLSGTGEAAWPWRLPQGVTQRDLGLTWNAAVEGVRGWEWRAVEPVLDER